MQWLSSNWSISSPQREAAKKHPGKPRVIPTSSLAGMPACGPPRQRPRFAAKGSNLGVLRGIFRNHLLGVPKRRFRQLRPAEHARHFLGAFSAFDAPYGSFGPSPSRLFLDQVMLVG